MDPARFEDMRPGCFDIDARIADMDLGRYLGLAVLPLAGGRILRVGLFSLGRSRAGSGLHPGLERLAPRGVGRVPIPIGSSRCSYRGWPTSTLAAPRSGANAGTGLHAP